MYQRYRDGFVEAVSGCMFAGKTEELIRRIKTLEFAHKKIAVFKPRIDDRYSKTKVASHAGSAIESIVIDGPEEIFEHIDESTEVVAIDEVQFFPDSICDVLNELANRHIRVICAGLDTDFRGEPFGPMPKIICQAEFVTKLTAVCSVCGAPATRTQRLINGLPAHYSDPTILVGASESYEARCRHCHKVLKD